MDNLTNCTAREGSIHTEAARLYIALRKLFENRRCRYKEFSKSEAEAYLLYVEHSLLRNDAVDAPYIFKSLDLEFPDLSCQTLNTPLILLRNLVDFLYGVVDLHRS